MRRTFWQAVEEQGLCIGATFGIKAYNGWDGGRRINVLGFCRNVEMLHDHVAAHIRGGEIVAHEYKLEGLHENLKLYCHTGLPGG